MLSVHEQLHELEEELIQIHGLMKALQQVLPDGEARSCVADVLEERLVHFRQKFYRLWDTLSGQEWR